MIRQSLNPFKARSTGIAVAIMALLSACSSQSSNKSAQDSNARTSRSAASLALQAKANAEAGLARKAQAKDGAMLFVKQAQNACRELTRKIEALTTDSTVGFSELNSFIPPELYPTDPFAAYVNERTLADMKSQLTQLVGSVVELLRSLEHSQTTSTARIDRQPDDVIAYRAAFQQKKLQTLASTDTYCESVRAAGAGVGALR
jgi:hypothetical protein